MERLFQLNFPRYVFRLRMDAAPPQIWDGVRKRWLVLTPEEWVRQHLIRFLVEEKGAFAACVSQERPVELAGTGRCDGDRSGRPDLSGRGMQSSARPARRAGARPGGTLQQRAGGSFHIGYERAAACLLPARCGIGALLPYCRIPRPVTIFSGLAVVACTRPASPTWFSSTLF